VSYLDPPRVHFAGRFLAAISTVNNDVVHYDTANFKPEYQLPQTDTADNGWFNPQGSGDWRLLDVAVTGAVGPDGAPAAQDDPVRAALVADSDRAAPAKLVDLDPQQQLVSTIWGLQVRLTTATGENLLRGRFRPVAFTDIWNRAAGAGAAGDVGAGAMYQSVLTDLEWGDVEASAVLTALRDRGGDRLSIKFNVDGINLEASSPLFMTGRIVGTLGPAVAGEPDHFVPGRQFMTFPRPGPGGFFSPAYGVNHCVGVVDEAARCVRVDLGNAMPTAAPGGALVDVGALRLSVAVGRQVVRLGQVERAVYAAPAWYPDTAGVVTFPPDRQLTDDELAAVATWPLILVGARPNPAESVRLIAEHSSGLHVRADKFVYRLDPEKHDEVRLIATRFGRPYPGATVVAQAYGEQFQVGSALGPAPEVMTPPEGLEHPDRVVTGADGVAVLPIVGHDPGNPRGYVDGQLYGIYPALEETLAFSPASPYPFNQWSFVTVLVWDALRQSEKEPTWHGTIEPILEQYANLYPVMSRFLNMADYADVVANLRLLELAFALDEEDPNSMPVTRDLSTAKRAAILDWLRHLDADGLPRRGTPPPAQPRSLAVAEGAPEAATASRPAEPSGPTGPPPRGGKAAAVERRVLYRGADPSQTPDPTRSLP
jgi:hypothetical protein